MMVESTNTRANNKQALTRSSINIKETGTSFLGNISDNFFLFHFVNNSASPLTQSILIHVLATASHLHTHV